MVALHQHALSIARSESGQTYEHIIEEWLQNIGKEYEKKETTTEVVFYWQDQMKMRMEGERE